MSFADIIGIISLIVGVVGVVVGIIGCCCLTKANKLKVEEINNSTINQADTLIVNNGVDTYAVIKIAKDITQEELKGFTDSLSATTLDLAKLREEIDAMPKIHIGKELPQNLKTGDIYLQYE